MRLPSLSETHYTRTAAPSPQGRWTPPQPGRVCAAKYDFFVLRGGRRRNGERFEIVEKRAVLRECKIRRRTHPKEDAKKMGCVYLVVAAVDLALGVEDTAPVVGIEALLRVDV